MSISEASVGQIFTSSLPGGVPDKSLPNKLSLTGLIRLCLVEIRDAKRAGHDWQVIASSLEKVAHQKFSQSEMRVNPNSVRTLYYLLRKDKRAVNKKRRGRKKEENSSKDLVCSLTPIAISPSDEVLPAEVAETPPESSEILQEKKEEATKASKKNTGGGDAGRFNFPKREGAPVLRAFGSTLK